MLEVGLLGLALHDHGDDQAEQDASDDQEDDPRLVGEEPREEVGDSLHEQPPWEMGV